MKTLPHITTGMNTFLVLSLYVKDRAVSTNIPESQYFGNRDRQPHPVNRRDHGCPFDLGAVSVLSQESKQAGVVRAGQDALAIQGIIAGDKGWAPVDTIDLIIVMKYNTAVHTGL